MSEQQYLELVEKVRLIWITPNVEQIIGYCARVSNPNNQDNPDVVKLLRYCIEHQHWSIFEMGNMCVELTTSRDISAQIIRHKSFSFQEFSQRYAEVLTVEPTIPRRQDIKNRQNSIDNLEVETKQWFDDNVNQINQLLFSIYNEALQKGIAKESARRILPMSSTTKMYMNGTIRSWIHYLNVRANPESGTQKEHFDLANEVKQLFITELPIVSNALNW